MKKTFISLVALSLAFAATGAIAAVGDFPTTDSDQNGLVSWAEFSLIYPDTTEEEFNTADVDGDGELSSDEFGTLTATGSIAAPPAASDEVQPLPESLSYDAPDP